MTKRRYPRMSQRGTKVAHRIDILWGPLLELAFWSDTCMYNKNASRYTYMIKVKLGIAISFVIFRDTVHNLKIYTLE